MKTQIIRDPQDKLTRLRQLGLVEEDLREVLRLAELDASTCTEFDPPGNEGHTRWASGTRFFRVVHCPRGWRLANNNAGLAATVDPSAEYQVVVATGDAGTGDPLAMPKTKNSRGPATEAAITENGAQLELLLFAGIAMDVKGRPETGLVTRFLLVHKADGEIRAELSVPADMDERGRVAAFTERIIIDPVALDPSAELRPKRFDEGDPVDVHVERKLD